jgi:hypothetical protein
VRCNTARPLDSAHLATDGCEFVQAHMFQHGIGKQKVDGMIRNLFQRL